MTATNRDKGVAVKDHGAGLTDEEVRLLDRFADATTSSPGARVMPIVVRDADCYVMRTVLDELGQLRKALRFYADLHNHAGVGVSRVYNDGGRRARQVLGECSDCKGIGVVKTGQRFMDQDGPYDEMQPCQHCWASGVAPIDQRAKTGGDR